MCGASSARWDGPRRATSPKRTFWGLPVDQSPRGSRGVRVSECARVEVQGNEILSDHVSVSLLACWAVGSPSSPLPLVGVQLLELCCFCSVPFCLKHIFIPEATAHEMRHLLIPEATASLGQNSRPPTHVIPEADARLTQGPRDQSNAWNWPPSQVGQPAQRSTEDRNRIPQATVTRKSTAECKESAPDVAVLHSRCTP